MFESCGEIEKCRRCPFVVGNLQRLDELQEAGGEPSGTAYEKFAIKAIRVAYEEAHPDSIPPSEEALLHEHRKNKQDRVNPPHSREEEIAERVMAVARNCDGPIEVEVSDAGRVRALMICGSVVWPEGENLEVVWVEREDDG